MHSTVTYRQSTPRLLSFSLPPSGMGFLSCITSHSLAYCCQGKGCGWYFCVRSLTGSVCSSRDDSGTEHLGVGSADSSLASRVVEVHLRWMDILLTTSSQKWPVGFFWDVRRSTRSLARARRDVRASSSLLKSCGRGLLTIGLSERRYCRELVSVSGANTVERSRRRWGPRERLCVVKFGLCFCSTEGKGRKCLPRPLIDGSL